MSIATRGGDDGTTSLLFGQRVSKDHPQIEAVGAFDELNAALGFAKATCTNPNVKTAIEQLQQNLVALMGEVACAESDVARYGASKFSKLTDADLARIDAAVAQIEATPVRFEGWATPGANQHAAALDLARTTARRAERRLIGLEGNGRNVRPLLWQFTNRLSDWLWLLARQAETD